MKIGLPCCTAFTERTEKLVPVRVRSTWYSTGTLGSPVAGTSDTVSPSEPVRAAVITTAGQAPPLLLLYSLSAQWPLTEASYSPRTRGAARIPEPVLGCSGTSGVPLSPQHRAGGHSLHSNPGPATHSLRGHGKISEQFTHL